MATLSNKSANLLGKRNREDDDFKTEPISRKHKETGRTLFIGHVSAKTNTSDIINFFNNVARVVRVHLIVNRKLIHRCYGYVEFVSSNDANKALQLKNGECLLGNKISLQVSKNPTHGFKFLMDHKVWYKDYLRRDGLSSIEEDDDDDETPPCSVEEQVLFVAHLSPQTRLLHIIDFFEDVGQVVSVRLIVNPEGKHVGYGFVEFASPYEANKALENKNGEYLHDHKIFLEVAKTARPRPKYNLFEKFCYEDYLWRQNLAETEEALDETPSFVEAVDVREKSLFIDKLSVETEISDIINFFKDVGEVVHVRLIVDETGERLGYGFVEFAYPNEAMKALEKKNGEHLHGQEIFLNVANKKSPYTQRPKYCIDHKVWYEDYLGRERLLIEEEAVEGVDDIPEFIREVATRKKTLFAANLPRKIQQIYHFFERKFAQVVRIRLIVDQMGNPMRCGFVELASVKQAKDALRSNDLHEEVYLDVAEMPPYPLRPKYNLAEKLWSEVESYLIEEEKAQDNDLETDTDMEEQDDVPMRGRFCGKKIIYSYEDLETDTDMEEQDDVPMRGRFCGKKIIFSYEE